MNFQTRSDCPIAIWLSGKSQFFSDRLDEFPNKVRFPIAIWQVSNPNVSPTVWMNFQTGSYYPIAIWQNVKSQFFRDRLDEFPNRVGLPNCDLTKCQFPIFPRPFGWISKSGVITKLWFNKMSIPNFSQTIWMNFQTKSDYPIPIWQSFKSQFFLDRLGEFLDRVWLPNCNLTKCQIPIFNRPGW